MITVTVNGRAHRLAEGTTVAGLLIILGIKARRLAVERNRQIVTRTTYEQTELAEGDQIEIVTLVGGG